MGYVLRGSSITMSGTANTVDRGSAVAVSVTTAGIVEHRASNGSTVVGTIKLPVGVHVLIKDPAETIANAASGGAVATLTSIAHSDN
jgi:hypothetical protein